jgi:hypothetical protein
LTIAVGSDDDCSWDGFGAIRQIVVAEPNCGFVA